MLVAGFSAYCRDIDFRELAEICHKHGVLLHADISHTAGLVAGDLLTTPFGHADTVMTTTHKTLAGPRGALIFTSPELDQNKLNKAVFPGLQGGPHMNNIAAICQCLIDAQT